MTPKQPTVFADHCDDFTAKGYNVTPTNGKRPILPNWQNLTPLPEWKITHATCNVGIVTGHNITAIDIDVLDELIATLIEKSATEFFGFAPCRYGKKPKRLLVYRTDEEIHKHKITFNDSTGNPHAVEILAKGQQFIAAGTHPETQQPYEWETELLPVAELTVVTLEPMRAWLESLKTLLAEHNCTGFKITGLNKVEVQAIKPNAPIDFHNAEQAKAVIERLQNKLLEAANGDRHAARLRIGKVFGGYVAGGLVHENDALEALQVASDLIADDGGTSTCEWQTILDAVEHGKESPITSYDTPVNVHNDILDGEKHHCTVDLLRHIDDEHPSKELSLYISHAMDLPVNSSFVMGLATFSSIACRKYVVNYQHNDSIPIGIYAVAEQPSGVGKSRCLTLFQKPFFKVHKEKCDLYNLERKRLEGIEPGKLSVIDKASLAELKNNPIPQLFTTNSTPEALEKSLDTTNGTFSAVSSEQGLFNSLLGLSYSDGKKANNNDLILNAFDGGYMCVKRITRDGYSGYVAGGVALFAQPGSIEKLLNNSHGTGLVERFLMIAEPHQLGKRDHTVRKNIPQEVIDNYAKVAEPLCRSVLNKEAVTALNISDHGHNLIALYQNQIEPHLADGGKYSHISLRGAAGKINMQIMKIAANLHLLAKNDDAESPLVDKAVTLEELQARSSHNLKRPAVKSDIDDKHVIAAIGIANELLEANLKLCQDKGILGVKAEYTAILNYLTNKANKTERELINSLRTTLPFKESTGNKAEEIKKAIVEMVAQGVIAKSFVSGKILYSIA